MSSHTYDIGLLLIGGGNSISNGSSSINNDNSSTYISGNNKETISIVPATVTL